MEKEKKFNKQEYDNKYIKEKYDRLNFVMPKGTKDKIYIKASGQNISSSEYLRKIINDSINGHVANNICVPDLEAYAKSAGLAPEEYIKAAIKEKMQRQDADFKEPIERVKFN